MSAAIDVGVLEVVVHEEEAHPCAFAAVGMHDPESINDFHDLDGDTVLVEWTWDDAIMTRGLRSWVCRVYVEKCVAIGWVDFMVVGS